MELNALQNLDIPNLIGTLSDASLTFGGITLHPYTIIKSIVVICFLLWLTGRVMRRLDRRLSRTDMHASNRALVMKMVQISLYCLVAMMGMQVLGINLTALSVFSGALGVGLGFGLQKIASNFVSGIILLFEKSIEVGDLIELSDGTTGFVRRTNARYTLLETRDGKEVLIPNEEFINQRVISWTHTDTQARVMIPITIAYDSDFTLAKRLMTEVADAHPKRINDRPSLTVLHAFRDSGVELNLYFWVADVTDGRMEPKSDVMLAILAAFKTHGIAIPYPQHEVRLQGALPTMKGTNA